MVALLLENEDIQMSPSIAQISTHLNSLNVLGKVQINDIHYRFGSMLLTAILGLAAQCS